MGLLLIGAPASAAPPRERIGLNENWRFTQGDPPQNTTGLLYDIRPPWPKASDSQTNQPASPPPPLLKSWILPTGNDFIKDPLRKFKPPEGNPGGDVHYVQSSFDDSLWQLVNLPHDWAIEGPFTRAGGGGMGRLPSAGVGWYRKKLSIPAEDAGKSIFLEMDGAMSYSTVWVNGRLAGGWPFGYASWQLDLTAYVNVGAENTIVLRLDNPPNSSRWYPGGGIYRNVWLVKTGPVHVGHWGTQVTTPDVSREQALVRLQTTVHNDSKQPVKASVRTEFFCWMRRGKRPVAPWPASPP